MTWSTDTRLPDGIHLLPRPDYSAPCAYCGRAGVVATNDTHLACVRCMPSLGAGPPPVAGTRRTRHAAVGLAPAVVGLLALLGIFWMGARAMPTQPAPVVMPMSEAPMLPRHRDARLEDRQPVAIMRSSETFLLPTTQMIRVRDTQNNPGP